MPVLSGVDLADASGVGLLDGVAAILGEANLDFAAILTALNNVVGSVAAIPTTLNYEWLADRLAEWLGTDRVTLGEAVLSLLAMVPLVGDMINEVTALGILEIISGLDPKVDAVKADTEAILAGGGAGDAAILAAIAAVRGAGNPDIAGVLTAIAAIPGLGPTEYTLIANYVWARYLDNALSPTLTADQALTLSAMYGIRRQEVGAIQQLGDQHFHVELSGTSFYSAPEAYSSPAPDYSDILPGDTVLSWLQRTETVRGDWELDTATGLAVSYTVLSGENIYRTVCDLRDLELHALAIRSGPPVWPGEAGITRGTSVPLAAGVVLSGTMHGVEIYITATERAIPFVSADTFKLYKSLGRYTFVNDAGDLEPWQPIPADVAQLMPKAMAVAAGCLLSFYTGVTGTVTPFTINT